MRCNDEHAPGICRIMVNIAEWFIKMKEENYENSSRTGETPH